VPLAHLCNGRPGQEDDKFGIYYQCPPVKGMVLAAQARALAQGSTPEDSTPESAAPAHLSNKRISSDGYGGLTAVSFGDRRQGHESDSKGGVNRLVRAIRGLLFVSRKTARLTSFQLSTHSNPTG
jgi:hypothetical protein